MWLFFNVGSCGGSDGLSLCYHVSNVAGCSLFVGGIICSCNKGYHFDDPKCSGVFLKFRF